MIKRLINCTYLFEIRLSLELEVSKSDNLLWLRILRRICDFLGVDPSPGVAERFCEIQLDACFELLALESFGELSFSLLSSL